MTAKNLPSHFPKILRLVPVLADAFIESGKDLQDSNCSTATIHLKVRSANGGPILGLAQHNFSVSSCSAESVGSQILPVLKATYRELDSEYEVQVDAAARSRLDLMRYPVTVYISRALNCDGFIEVGHACC